jgi:pre-mRNA-splicing factor CDC5/CEF1
LPAPKNDYEIVVPEDELNDDEANALSNDVVEDQADVDARKQQQLLEQRNKTLR